MVGVGVVIEIVELCHFPATLHKGIEITLLRIVPLQFGQSIHTRHSHILHMTKRSDVFRPDVGLHTDDVLLLLGGQFLGQGLELIHTFHGQVTAYAFRFAGDVFALIVVEIEVRTRCHDDIVTFLCRCNATFCTAPAHNDGRLGDIAFQNLIPADNTAATSFHHLRHTVHHIALKVVLGGELIIRLDAQLLNLGLTLWALLPAHLRAFVATDMDIGRRKHIHHLIEHILDE